MSLPITLFYAGFFSIFALVLSFRAGTYRGKAKASILYGEPTNWELAQRVRVHQNLLEYVPLMLIMMGLIEANGGPDMYLYVVGDLLILARIAHAIGLKHDDMANKWRAVGAGGTALITLVTAGYAFWISTPAIIARFSGS